MNRNYIYIGIGIIILIVIIALIVNNNKSNDDGDSNNGNSKGGGNSGNSIDNVIGLNIYPSQAYGYTNVRSSTQVDNGYFGVGGNKIGEATAKPFGKIKSVLLGNDQFRWYKVELTPPIDSKRYGFVRTDAVSLNE